MSRLTLVAIGVAGLVVGAVAGGAAGVFEDTKTETAPAEETVTVAKTQTKTVRKGGGAAQVKTVTRVKTVTAPQSYTAPGETTPGGPRTTVEGTRTFTGKGTKNFGTLTVKKTSTLEWTNSGPVFSVISQSQLHVSSEKKRGSVKLYKGTYDNFRVAAVGRWKVTISPR